MPKNKFWNFNNISNDETELMLYGEIASERPWYDESEMVVQNEFINELNQQQGKNLKLRINSVGGDVFAAHSILTNLKLYKEKYNANIIVQIDGLAASAATILMTAGDIIKSPSYANIMMHDPAMLLMGWYNEDSLQKVSNAWNSIKESIINSYVLRFNMDKEEITKIMKAETWMTGEEAKEKGFVDEIMFIESDNDMVVSNDNDYVVVAGVKHDISSFKNKPIVPMVANKINQPTNIPKQAVNNINKINKEKEGSDLVINSIEELKAQYPELTNQIKNEGVEEERNRIKAIEEIATNITPELVNKAKFEECINAEQLALEALKNNSLKGQEYLNNLEDDVKNSNINDIKAIGDEGNNNQKPKDIHSQVKAVATEFDYMRRGVKQ